MLDGRDGDAVDVADGAVADAQSGEQAKPDVVFLQVRILLAQPSKTVVVDGIECPLYLAPFVWTEIDERIVALAELLHHLRTFQDEVLQECHHLVGLAQQCLLVLRFLLQLALLLSLCLHAVADYQCQGHDDDERCHNGHQECPAIHLGAVFQLTVGRFLAQRLLVVSIFLLKSLIIDGFHLLEGLGHAVLHLCGSYAP